MSATPSASSQNPWRNNAGLEDLRLGLAGLNTEDPPSADRPEKRIRVIHNAHQDDIHAIIRVGDTLFSGSKDGAIKQWDLEGNLLRTIEQLRGGQVDYRKWITAFSPINANLWVSGRRSGDATLWDSDGNFIKELPLRHGPFPEGFEGRSKDRNVHRINCLAPFQTFDRAPVFFAGWATQFTMIQHNTKQGTIRRHQYAVTSDNDWVYAMEAIDFKNLLVVTGTQLDLFSREENRLNSPWNKSAILIPPVEWQRGMQRPFISAITKLNDTGHYGLAIFGGAVRIYDVEAQQTVFDRIEHRNRVWAIEKITESSFASCADDGLIKLWDPRAGQRSIATVRDNMREKARVSNLMLLNEHELLSCSCPDDVHASQTKGQFTFWDTRLLPNPG